MKVWRIEIVRNEDSKGLCTGNDEESLCITDEEANQLQMLLSERWAAIDVGDYAKRREVSMTRCGDV